MWADFVQAWPEVLDEFQERIANETFIPFLIRLKPIAIILPLKLFEELEDISRVQELDKVKDQVVVLFGRSKLE